MEVQAGKDHETNSTTHNGFQQEISSILVLEGLIMKSIYRCIAILMIVALAFGFLPAGAVSADPPDPCTTDCYVSPTGNDAAYGYEDSPFLTIQKGIDAVAAGGTVHVAAGTYDEENILIGKGLTLQGAGAGSSFIAPSAETDNSTIVVDNPSGDVLIDGFTFTMQPKPNHGSAVVVQGTSIAVDGATVTISNNVVNGSDNSAKSDYGFYGQNNHAALVITKNEIHKTGDNPIVMENQFGSTTVSYNKIWITDSPDYNPYFSMAHSGANITTPQIVEYNEFYLDHGVSGYSEAITFDTAVRNGWYGTTTDTGYYTDIRIRNNKIYTGGAYARGIGLWDLSAADGMGTISNAQITENEIIGEDATDAETYGITLRGDIEGTVIQGNTISDVNLGIWLRAGSKNGVHPSGSDIFDNKIAPTVTALNNESTIPVDVSPNWWGSADGPPAGAITGPAVYIPWCMTDACTAPFGHPPFHNTTKDTYYTTLQAAIADADADDTIEISDGTYVETGQIVIDKNLTITGASQDGTIIQPAQDVASWVLVNQGVTFNLTNLTLDGNGKTITSGLRTGGLTTVDHVNVKNIAAPGYSGYSILMDYNNTVPQSLKVTNSTITDFGRVGIQTDKGNAESTAEITGNTITCTGPGDKVNYGITVEGGAVATITGNTITNCYGIASDGSESAAIEITTYFGPGTTATITGNFLYNNLNGILVGYDSSDTSTVTAENNKIYNITNTLISSSGTAASVDASPNWWGTNDEGEIQAKVAGSVTYEPYWYDEDMTLLYPVPCTTDCYVDPSGDDSDYGNANSPFKTIQKGIDAVTAGGTVHVAAGTYQESVGGGRDLVINKSLNLVGAGKGQTIIELTNKQNGLEVSADATGEVKVEGFTFTKIAANPNSSSWGAVRVGDSGNHFSSLIFRDVEIAYAGTRNLFLSGAATYGYVELDNVDIHHGGWYGFSLHGNVDTAVVKDSKFSETGVNDGSCQYIGFLIESPNITTKLTIDDSEFINNMGDGLKLVNAKNATLTNITSTGNCYGISLASYGSENAKDIKIINPTLTGNSGSGLFMGAWPGTTLENVEVTGGRITDNVNHQVHILKTSEISGTIKNINIHKVYLTKLLAWEPQTPPIPKINATGNWWGSPDLAVVQSRALGYVDFSNWCTDPTCSGTVWYAGGSIQAAIDAAHPGDTIYIEPGNYNEPGGAVVNKENLKIILTDGVVIQNNSPCFIVEADYTTISTESPGGAKCVPTDGANGVDVTAGRVNVIIEGLEISGVGQTTGNGIHFAGAATDVVISSNKIHDLGGDGLFFASTPAGVVDIQGNLFQNNAGVGINNTGSGATTIDARYNSWGDPDGPTGANGDGVSANVDYADWTYMKVYMESSGTFWPSIALATRGTITYTFYADLVGATGLDFTFAFPFYAVKDDSGGYCYWYGCAPIYEIYSDSSNRPLRIVSTTENGTDFTPVTGTSLLDTARHFGYVNFAGLSKSGPVTATKKELFSVTFDVKSASLVKPLPFYDEVYETGISDRIPPKTLLGAELFPDFNRASFSMSPPAGPSNVIFASEMADGTVKAINYPNAFAAGSSLNNYHLTGEQRQFTLVVTNPPKGGTYAANLRFKLLGAEVGDVSSFEMETAPGVWTPVVFASDGSGNIIGDTPAGGIPITPSASLTYNFRVTFAEAGTYPVEISTVYSTENYVMKTDIPATGFIVYGVPVITSSTFAGPYSAEVPENVSLNITNPSALVGPFTLVFEYPDGTTILYDSVTYTCLPAGCPSIPVALGSASNDLDFVVTIPTAYSGPIKVSLYDTDPAPDRLLATLEETTTSFAAVTGTVSMQGRSARDGVPVVLAGPFTYTATSTSQISNNVKFASVAPGTYAITTDQPRYLNVRAALGKTTNVTGNTLLTALELKGGNAVYADDVIDILDASRVGTDWNKDITHAGDVNFSGKVDIFDLALVGGNFNKTAADFYTSWIP